MWHSGGVGDYCLLCNEPDSSQDQGRCKCLVHQLSDTEVSSTKLKHWKAHTYVRYNRRKLHTPTVHIDSHMDRSTLHALLMQSQADWRAFAPSDALPPIRKPTARQ